MTTKPFEVLKGQRELALIGCEGDNVLDPGTLHFATKPFFWKMDI